MRNRPWSLAQFGVAALLAVISLIGIIGTLAFDAAELTFSFAGAIQAFAIFPGFVLSLIVNGVLMGVRRAPQPGTALRVLLVVEFVLIAALVLFHFYVDPAGATFGLAIFTWPFAIALAVVIAVVAAVRLARSSGDV
jgi:hypothetical protein